MFKYLLETNGLVYFSWCEVYVASHAKNQIVPGLWQNETTRLFADGIGCQDKSEVILMESFSGFPEERMDPSIGDTWKLIRMTTDSLCNMLTKFQDSSIETSKKLATSVSIPNRWGYNDDMVMVFELLAMLHIELYEQKSIENKLREEKNGLIEVDPSRTLRSPIGQLHTSVVEDL
ncbi:hypothetical protein INT45_010391 [Circinella minor]|uniref:Uncharacterized protein n=1 Tax=Circinella minor TaxID=1195481 RepID=A0A8H7RLW4_9FUNG|nr:hypothetical protein INT45_010391 [Circinella minor]